MGDGRVDVSMIFAGVSGAAVADIAGLGMVEIRAMRDRGYPADFAAALATRDPLPEDCDF